MPSLRALSLTLSISLSLSLSLFLYIYLCRTLLEQPTRASRFYIAHWFSGNNKNKLWNGQPDDWNGGSAGDGKKQSMTTLIKSVTITPFNEANDIVAASLSDMPDGCTSPYYSKYPSSPAVCHPFWERYPIPAAQRTGPVTG